MKVISLIIAAIFVGIAFVACTTDHSLLHERTANWQSEVDKAIPPASTIETAKAWGVTKGVKFINLEEQHKLYALVEKVPEQGLNRYICSEWNITLKIDYTEGGATIRNQVRPVGVCL